MSRPAGALVWLRRAALLAVLVYLALFAWTGQRVGAAEEAFTAGRLDEADRILAGVASWHVRAGRVHDALGVVELARGRLVEGRAHLAAARRGFFHPPAFGDRAVLARFLRDGLYEPAQIYAAHRLELSGEPAMAMYLGTAENGLNRLDDAEKHLALAAADPALKTQVEAQRARIAEKRRTGRSSYLVDRSGTPLAAIDVRSGRASLLVPDLASLLDGPAGLRLTPDDTKRLVRLSLDLEMQRAAEAALGSRRGALVVIDVATGGLLAAASQPAGVPAPGGLAPAALAATYEPGSIIKMITLAAALRKGLDVPSMFPQDCPGWLAIDGVAFRDWMPHKRVESVDQAAAVSCNLAFGRMGQAVGRDALDAELRRFGFDTPAGQPAADDAELKYRPGSLLPPDAAHPDYALARRAIGLDSIEITPIGAALIAAGLARGGVPPVAHLVEEKTNILGETLYKHDAAQAVPGGDDPLPAGGRELLARVMRAAVTGAGRAEGTARRAAVPGVDAAMKTGTSGKNPPGYDALVIGFAPAEKPIIAWGLVAEHAGKAEFEGARITGDFLKRIQARLR